MRVLLDTNVLVSAFLYGGVPREILLPVAVGGYELITSVALVAELQDVLLQKFGVPPTVVAAFRSELESSATIVQPAKRPELLDDPLDDEVLAVAAAASAQFIVSGDRHLLAVGSHEGASIFTPRQFSDWLGEQS
ncbi:MAG: putative toxin-antitoxin system toxin component, PIN family [Actinobacteria bacterium]|nr:putative toxin-antitoxin system toxin component, PIN family [Actinomycetota bacterium]